MPALILPTATTKETNWPDDRQVCQDLGGIDSETLRRYRTEACDPLGGLLPAYASPDGRRVYDPKDVAEIKRTRAEAATGRWVDRGGVAWLNMSETLKLLRAACDDPKRFTEKDKKKCHRLARGAVDAWHSGCVHLPRKAPLHFEVWSLASKTGVETWHREADVKQIAQSLQDIAQGKTADGSTAYGIMKSGGPHASTIYQWMGAQPNRSGEMLELLPNAETLDNRRGSAGRPKKVVDPAKVQEIKKARDKELERNRQGSFDGNTRISYDRLAKAIGLDVRRLRGVLASADQVMLDELEIEDRKPTGPGRVTKTVSVRGKDKFKARWALLTKEYNALPGNWRELEGLFDHYGARSVREQIAIRQFLQQARALKRITVKQANYGTQSKYDVEEIDRLVANGDFARATAALALEGSTTDSPEAATSHKTENAK